MSVTFMNKLRKCHRRFRINTQFCFVLAILSFVSLLTIADGQEVVTLNSASYDLEDLISTETVIIETMREYIDTLEEKINIIKRFVYILKLI